MDWPHWLRIDVYVGHFVNQLWWMFSSSSGSRIWRFNLIDIGYFFLLVWCTESSPSSSSVFFFWIIEGVSRLCRQAVASTALLQNMAALRRRRDASPRAAWDTGGTAILCTSGIPSPIGLQLFRLMTFKERRKKLVWGTRFKVNNQGLSLPSGACRQRLFFLLTCWMVRRGEGGGMSNAIRRDVCIRSQQNRMQKSTSLMKCSHHLNKQVWRQTEMYR